MSWWLWIIVWVALLALALLGVVALGFLLWRRARAALRAVTAVGAELTTRWEQGVAAESGVTLAPRDPPGAAVFATPEQMKDDYLAAKGERRFARLQRRVARRKERGQLQSLRDIEALQDVG